MDNSVGDFAKTTIEPEEEAPRSGAPLIGEMGRDLDPEEAPGLDEPVLPEGELSSAGTDVMLGELAREASSEGGGRLSIEEEMALFGQIEGHGELAGNAMAELYRRNQGLVRSVVSRYRRKDSWLDFEDLVLEGNIGLLEAMKGFELDKGSRFSTYAYRVIRGRVLRAQEKDPRVVKPFTRIAKELLILMDDFYADYYREPGYGELLDYASGLKDKDGRPIWDGGRLKLAERRLRQNWRANSLDAPLPGGEEDGDDGDDAASLGDFLSGKDEVSAADAQVEHERERKIAEAIDGAMLDPNVEFLLKQFLMDPHGVYDNSEVAERLGNPSKDKINELLVENLQDEDLLDGLVEKGLL